MPDNIAGIPFFFMEITTVPLGSDVPYPRGALCRTRGVRLYGDFNPLCFSSLPSVFFLPFLKPSLFLRFSLCFFQGSSFFSGKFLRKFLCIYSSQCIVFLGGGCCFCRGFFCGRLFLCRNFFVCCNRNAACVAFCCYVLRDIVTACSRYDFWRYSN